VPLTVTFRRRQDRPARVRYSDKTPVALEAPQLPFPRFAGLRDLDLDETSVYATLEQEWGVHIGVGKFVLDIAHRIRHLPKPSANRLAPPCSSCKAQSRTTAVSAWSP